MIAVVGGFEEAHLFRNPLVAIFQVLDKFGESVFKKFPWTINGGKDGKKCRREMGTERKKEKTP